MYTYLILYICSSGDKHDNKNKINNYNNRKNNNGNNDNSTATKGTYLKTDNKQWTNTNFKMEAVSTIK